MSEWQPIETAPKDGTIVLVWSENSGRVIDHYAEDYRSWYRFTKYLQPTHWMPLPKPPKSIGGEDD